jgi:hypothetical protein
VDAFILRGMNLIFDSCWRACAYCFHPRVILLSFLPLLIIGALAGVLGYFYWETALVAVRSQLESWALVEAALGWMDAVGMGGLRTFIAPLIVLALAVPTIVMLSLLLVALLMTPAIVSLVAKRRFPMLERRQGEALWRSVLFSLGTTVLALAVLVASMPLWLVPPLILLLPPVIWGWLTYRVMSFDALADHATREERRGVMREHRWPLLTVGIIVGYLGAAPSLIWALGAVTIVFAPFFIFVAIWLYMLVFAFASLWFTHYCLTALQSWRATHDVVLAAPAPPPAVPPELPTEPVLTRLPPA